MQPHPHTAVDPASYWQIDSEIDFLNHGSFGACPTPVQEAQQELRSRLEREPVAFFMRDYEELLDTARQTFADFVKAEAGDIVFVSNATEAINAVLRSLTFAPGDELLITDHAYNACRNALEYVADRAGARVVVARCPFPLKDPQEVVDAVAGCITDRTRLALIDHITSPTGLVMPIQQLVDTLHEHGVETLVDGAHAPGMLDINLKALNPTYYTGNCHKWLCTPKGSAFLYVTQERQTTIRPLAISHGANSARKDRSRFHLEFDWIGTVDPTAWFAIPSAIAFLGSLFEDGFEGLRRHNHELILYGRKCICDTFGTPLPAPDSMIGSIASVPLPDSKQEGPVDPARLNPLQDALYHEARIVAPIVGWPAPPKRWIRISAQLYNRKEQYERLAEALPRLAEST